MKVVEVFWRDAWIRDGPREADDIDTRPLILRTVGYLVKEDKNGIVVALESYTDGRWRHIQFISKAMIMRKKVVRR